MVQPVINIRKLTIEDLQYAQVATDVVNAAYRAEGGWTTERHIVGGLRCTVDDMKKYIKENGKPNTTLFAFEGTEVLGTVQIQIDESHPKEGEIGLLSVSPQQQSRGIGSQLVKTALTEMKAIGLEFAVMHVLENRLDILAWYKKLGFKETGETIPFFWPELLKGDKNVHFKTLKKPL